MKCAFQIMKLAALFASALAIVADITPQRRAALLYSSQSSTFTLGWSIQNTNVTYLVH
jgi:hypothetical protein